MNPDYTQQLERLITLLSPKGPVPSWVISIIGVVTGAVLTMLLGIWKEQHEARLRRAKLERAICGEILLNHSSLFGTLATDYEFNRIKPTQTPFGGIFTFDALDNARAQGDVVYEIPNFAAMRTLYKMYQNMVELHGGTEPHLYVFWPVSNRSADLERFRAVSEQTPTAHSGNAQLEKLCDLMFVQQSSGVGQGRRFDRGRGDGRQFLDGRFWKRLFSSLAILNFQFSNSEVQALDLLEGKHVDFTQKFDDPGLGSVHERIMAVAVAGGARGLPDGLRTNWGFGAPGRGILGQLAIEAPAVISGKAKQREDPTNRGEVAWSFLRAAVHIGVKPLPCEFACFKQPPMRLLPLTGGDALLIRLLRIALVRDEVDQSSFAAPFAPTFYGELAFGFRFWNRGSRR